MQELVFRFRCMLFTSRCRLLLHSGWSSGKVDGRNIETGEVLFKDNFDDPIASVIICDYNQDGVEELVVCSVAGEVRGYVPSQPHERQFAHQSTFEQEQVRELMRRRANLQLELRNYEENTRVAQSASEFAVGKASTEDDTFGAIPANTQLKSSLIINAEDKQPSVQLSLSTTNDTQVRTAVVFAEGIFQGESFVVHPSDMDVENQVTIALRPPKDIPIDLHIKAMVGYRGSFHYHVFEMTRRLPKFAMYSVISDEQINVKPKGTVVLTLHERCARVVQWINKNFLLAEELSESLERIHITFLALRDGHPITLDMNRERLNEFVITTDNMELAGDIIQSLVAEYLSIDNLTSVATFPGEIESLKRLIAKVEEIQNVRQQLAADIADNSAAVRALVVRAEDARLLGEFKAMKQLYSELNALNRELINEYKIRSQNHQDLVSTLKVISSYVAESVRKVCAKCVESVWSERVVKKEFES